MHLKGQVMTIQSIYFKIHYFVSTGTYSMVHSIYCIYRKLNDYTKCMLNGYINTGHHMSWYINTCISMIVSHSKKMGE